MKLQKIYANVQGRNVLIEHDQHTYIYIHDQPKELPHASSKSDDRLQNINMMDFQSKISMVLRTQAKQQGIHFPIKKGKYGVEITVTTQRPSTEVPIVETAKAIIDAVNKEVVPDDDNIYYLKIRVQRHSSRSRTNKSSPSDKIALSINDLTIKKTVVKLQELCTYIVPKTNPSLVNGCDEEFFYPHLELYPHYVWQALSKDGFQMSRANESSVKLSFTGAVQSKDLDNMVKCYLPIMFQTQSLKPSNVVELELFKVDDPNAKGSIEMHVNCNSMQP
ncbi:hypothetical protein [Virgibacillus ndiopensis]|uniref:hypothetical protein n=1 Tax=Virgibacillus ndiopensis TaxID=2004408 RepID=UPI000C08327B|nr:hypothetical protein [Virgibacillus ndiopensis]